MTVRRRKVLRDLASAPAQALGIIVTLLLGTALFTATSDAHRNLTASLEAAFDAAQAANLTISGGDRHAIAIAAGELPGVERIAVRTRADLPMELGTDRLMGRVIGVPASGRPSVGRLTLLDGAGTSAATPDGVLIERHAAEAFGLRPGDALRVQGPRGWMPLRVRGVVESSEYLWPAPSRQDPVPAARTFAVAFAPQATADALSSGAGDAQLLVRYAGGRANARLDDQLRRIAAASGALSAVPRAQEPSTAVIREDIDGIRGLAVLFPALFLLGAALATAVLLARRVRAERRVIGMLRASGAPRAAVRGHYARYGLVLGAASGVAGGLIGMVAARGVTHVLTGALEIPVTDAPLHPTTALMGALLAAATGLVGALLPASAAARLDPAVALSGRAAPTRTSATAGRLLGWLSFGSVRRRLVLRSIARSPRRSAATVIGIALAATLILTAWSLLDSTQALVTRQFGAVERQDATVVFSDGDSARAGLASVRAIPGVAGAEPAAQFDGTVVAGGRRYATSLLALPPHTAMHAFPDPQAPSQGLVVGSAMRDLLGLRIGESVQLAVGASPPVEIPVSGFVDEPLGTRAYLDLDQLTRLAGEQQTAVDRILVRLQPGTDAAAATDRLQRIAGVSVVVGAAAQRGAFDGYLRLLRVFVVLMLAFGATLAFVVLFTTMSANVAERAAEVTTLRASGVRERAIARLLRTESLLLTIAGLVVGLPVAWATAAWLAATNTSDLVRLQPVVDARTAGLAAALLLLVALTSYAPSLRAVRRLQTGQVVRERSD